MDQQTHHMNQTTPPTPPRTTEQPGAELRILTRSMEPPYVVRETIGYLPFEVFGEKFAVTCVWSAEITQDFWRATHIATGAAVPKTGCELIEDVPAKAREVLETVGREKLLKS